MARNLESSTTSNASHAVSPAASAASLSFSSENLERRYRAERRFRWYGRVSLGIILMVFGIILVGLIHHGSKALTVTEIGVRLPRTALLHENFPPPLTEIVLQALQNYSQNPFSQASVEDLRGLAQLVVPGAVRVLHQAFPELDSSSKNLSSSSEKLRFLWLPVDTEKMAEARKAETRLRGWIQELEDKNLLRLRWNQRFFTEMDSRTPEIAGLWGALVGSCYLVLMTLLFSFPVALGAALYLEEFTRKKGLLLTLIEATLSNLAAVPSIVFGLLGLAVFIQVFHFPRSSTLVGALTLSLMTLPTMLITFRTALKAVPRTLREAAFALGASRVQVTFHHVFPGALPTILTGTLISMARVLGETAPLLMIGMMAFVIDLPRSPWDPASALPIQIFNWVRNPEPGFMNLAAAGILVLLVVLVVMNLGAILLRKRFERPW